MKLKLSLLTLVAISTNSMASWDKITPSADFRYRLEDYKDEFVNEARSRQRIRARVSLSYEVDDVTKIKLRLATSGGASSTNDTLGDPNDGSASAVYFDRAYLNHKAGDVVLNMGRMKNPMMRAGKNQLIWDGDFNPEGIHTNYKYHGVYVNLGSFWVDENKAKNSAGTDVVINASQLGYENKVGSFSYNVGASGYNFQGSHETDITGTGEGVNLLEVYAQLKYNAKHPLVIFASSVENNEAKEDNKAMIVGFSIGKTSKKGSWKVGANHRTVELNSLYSNLMDSDFAAQKTDSSGSILWGKYMITDKSYMSFGYFMNTRNADEKADPSADSEKYTKLHLDYGVKF